MQTIADRITQRMNKLDISQAKIHRETGAGKATISSWIKGATEPSGKYIGSLAKVLKCDISWLVNGDEGNQPSDVVQNSENIPDIIRELQDKITAIENRDRFNATKELEPSNALSYNDPVPVIEWVAAGSWSEANAVMAYDAFDYLPRPFNFPENGFALKVRGVSMMPKFEPGDYIYVNPNYGFLELKNGDLVVVREGNNDEATFKQLVIGDTAEDMYLKPLNPDWHEQKMIPKSEWELVGKVVGKWTAF